MKKNYILGIIAIVSITFLPFQGKTNGTVEAYKKSHFLTSGGQPGLTGAPGEANCTQCHVGITQDGSTENTLIVLDGTTLVSNYNPGQSYTVSLQMESNPFKKGFSAVALDGMNMNAGSFTGLGVGGTQDFTASSREYVSHTASGSSILTPWFWTWNAPDTDVGLVTFYVASNIANQNYSSSGDLIYLSQHILGSTASITEETTFEPNFMAGYASNGNKLIIDFNSLSVGYLNLNLVDMNGRSLFTADLGESQIGKNTESIVLPNEIKGGVYIVNLFIGNKPMSSKIMIQK
jgi:hypothetical protein